MKSIIPAPAVLICLAFVAGCSQDSRPYVQNETMNQIIDGVADGTDTAIYYAGEGWEIAKYRAKIATFPKFQPVIIRAGTRIAKTSEEARQNLAWDYREEQRYNIELPSGERFIVVQAGPQFYENQRVTLMAHGLSVTLLEP